ncbi:MAG TPA: sulfur carrier protein ThiS [Candidatus Binataceae bacterium]|nr:sulfur carrier protein ThiS [Candidatus Binataceae bacterium]
MPQSTTTKAISITLNGDPYSLDGDARVAALLDRLNLRTTRVAVEINGHIVPRSDYAQAAIEAGDSVEIINFVGGG